MITSDSARYQESIYVPYDDYGNYIRWDIMDVARVVDTTAEDPDCKNPMDYVVCVPATFSRTHQHGNRSPLAEQYCTFLLQEFSERDLPYLKPGMWVYSAAGGRYNKRGGFRDRVWETSITPPWISLEERQELYRFIGGQLD